MTTESKFSNFADDVFVAVAGYIARCVIPLLARIEALEKRAPERGEKGEVGAPGKDGKDGAEGRDGRDGEPGRDAFAIDVLSGIDEARRYQRGTWAKHAGGLWLARSATDGMGGWECIVNGVASLEVVSDGARRFSVKSLLSDGQASTAEFVLKSIEYHGAWALGEYKAGDVVSWDGSMWHCEEPTSDKPGNSPAWKLCVKHGRDGKNGVRGLRGERGADGRPGRDFGPADFNGIRT